eukprot:3166789-Amphidinium_carterae.1
MASRRKGSLGSWVKTMPPSFVPKRFQEQSYQGQKYPALRYAGQGFGFYCHMTCKSLGLAQHR